MSLAIHGLGAAVPPDFFSQEIAVETVNVLCHATREQARLLPRIFNQAGIRKRHMVLGQMLVRDILEGTRHSQSVFLPGGKPGDRGPTTGQRMQEYVRHAGALAMDASRQALEHATISPRRITHLVTVSCTGFKAPGVDIELIQGLGLPATTERVHVGFMGCHGAINGLRVANALVGSSPNARVLLCAVELCSVHCVYEWDLEKMVASALFSDGAAALVGTRGADSSALRAGLESRPRSPGEASKDGDSTCWNLVANGSCVIPDSLEAMSWTVGDHGFEMTLSKRVPELIASHLPGWIASWLGEHELSVKDVASWCIHPGGPKILSAVVECLGLDSRVVDVSREIFADYGNMSSATILFILQRLIRQQSPRPCVALAFGPGLTAEAALFR